MSNDIIDTHIIRLKPTKWGDISIVPDAEDASTKYYILAHKLKTLIKFTKNLSENGIMTKEIFTKALGQKLIEEKL